MDADIVTQAALIEDGGVRFRILLPNAADDYIQKRLAAEGAPYEAEMLADMRGRLAPGDLVLDVGANIGNHTLYLASVGARVAAFEANAALAGPLQESVALNGFGDRVSVRCVGVGRAAGTARFERPMPENLGGQALTLGEGDIAVIALDSLTFDQPARMIKIDVEGMEMDVLAGAEALIARDRPLLYVECGDASAFAAVAAWMEQRRYALWDTFNATPTHLFLPAETVDLDQRMARAQARAAREDYGRIRQLAETRASLNAVNVKHRQVMRRVEALAAERDALQAERDAEAAAHAQQRARADALAVERDALQAERDAEAEAHAAARARVEALMVERDALQAGRDAEAAAHAQQRARADALMVERDALQAGRDAEAAAHAQQRARADALAVERDALQAERDAEAEARAAARARVEALAAERDALQAERDAEAAAHAATRDRADALRAGLLRQMAEAAPPATVGAAAAIHVPLTPAQERPAATRRLRVACILDEFSFAAFAPEGDFLQLTPAGWAAEIAAHRPDLLFVESAWRGKDDLWSGKIGHGAAELDAILAWCRANGVPTAFWNKEDPVHFQSFLNTAHRFDHVFTTDIDCVGRYRAAFGHDRAHFLPFACQPAIHNPLELFRRKEAISFAGAYYARYPERTRVLERFVDRLPAFRPLEIFDRNFGKSDPRYAFPPEFRPMVVGTLPADQIALAYKGYRYAINLNSISQSQSMFARRVFELLACGTTVISNHAQGLKLMFGDLVIATDDADEALRRLRALEAESCRAARIRHAALRKTLTEHTYADRMAQVRAAVAPAQEAGGDWRPPVLVVAEAQDQAAADRLAAQFRAQSHAPRRMALALARGLRAPDDPDIAVFAPGDQTPLSALTGPQDWIACFSAQDHYGPQYLADLLLATRFSTARLIGKAAHWRAAQDRTGDAALTLRHEAQAWRPLAACPARRAVIRADGAGPMTVTALASAIDRLVWRDADGLAADPWHYCADAADAGVGAQVDDVPDIDAGLSLTAMQAAADVAPPAALDAAQDNLQDAAWLAALFASRGTKTVAVETEDDVLALRSTLAHGKHEYLYADRALPLDIAANGADGVFRAHLEVAPGLNLSLVALFLDAGGARLGHAILPANANGEAAIPEGASQIRLGLRVLGGGVAEVRSLSFAHRDLLPPAILARADSLVLTNHYPAYDDLYRNGFVHSRVRAYRAQGVRADVFRLRPAAALRFSEFEGVPVMTGDAAALERLLAGGGHRAVMVHFLDAAMWDVLSRHLDRVAVTVWVHGAEVQHWRRRAFEFERLSQAEIARRKALSDQRMAFWRGVMESPHPSLRLVFVSRHLAEEVMADVGVRLPDSAYRVIHNPIDTGLFAYHPKSADQRGKILSIRPYASRVYANDLSVAAILKLADQPFFRDLSFRLIGDGPLFDETLAPLRGLPNVTIERRFLTQAQIADLHREHGVFLCPSRMDSQGVSRDEAMASGLVPVTNAVAAIPEFVDEGCGVLAPAEDADALAEGIAGLWREPERFLRLSAAAAGRVRRQSAAEQVIAQEIALVERRPDLTPVAYPAAAGIAG